MKTDVKKIFGSNVFNDAVMKERLPKAAYKKMKATIDAGAELDPEVADIVAHEMKARIVIIADHGHGFEQFSDYVIQFQEPEKTI